MKNSHSFSIFLSLLFSLYTLLAQDNPELVIQTGHAEGTNVKSVAFSPDGRYIASCGNDKVVKVWLTSSTQELRTFVHEDGLRAVVFLPDSKFLLVAGANKVFKWDLEKNKLVWTFSGHETEIFCIAISSDGKHLVSSSNHTVKLWNIQEGTCERTIKLKETVTIGNQEFTNHIMAVTFSIDGKYIFGGGPERFIYMWETATGSLVKKFAKHDHGIESLVVSPDGKKIASSTYLGVKTWYIKTGKEDGSFGKQTSDYLCAVSFSPDGKYLIEGNNQLRLWDAETANLIIDYQEITSGKSIAFSPDGSTFVAISGEKIKHFQTLNGKLRNTFQGHTSELYDVVRSKNGKWAITCGRGKTIKFWNTETGKLSKTITYTINSISIMAMDVSQDDKHLLIADTDKSISLWDIETGKMLWKYDQIFTCDINYVNRSVHSIAFAKDGKTALLGSMSEILLWDVQSNKELKRYKGHKNGNEINEVAFSPDEKYFASACNDKTIKLWNTATGEIVTTFTSSQEMWDMFKTVQFTPDGKYLIAGSFTKNLRIWKMDERKLICNLVSHTASVNALDISPNGKFVVTASNDKTLKLWEINTGKELNSFVGHLGIVTSVVFNKDGSKIISVSQDGTVRYWDVSTGKEILACIGFKDNINFLDITPDGYYFGSKGAFNQGVFYLKGLKMYSFDQFDLQYNRPDIVLQRLGKASPKMITTYKKAWEKRLKKMGFNAENFEAQRTFNAPDVVFAPGTPAFVQTQQPTYSFSFSGADKLFNLNRLNIYVNGVPLYGVKGKHLPLSKTTEQTISLTLSEGKNIIAVSVMNEKGVESLSERLDVTYTPKAPTKPNLYVIAVGVSEFSDESMNLTYAAKDAEDLATLLKTKSDLYGNINIQLFTNKKATKAEILKTKSMLLGSKPDDEVIVFVASHGLLDKNLDYFIATSDIDFNNPSEKGLPYEDLENLIDNIPARKKLMLIDACHSGEVDKEEQNVSKQSNFESIASSANSNVKSRGFMIKNTNEVSQDSDLENSFELMKELFADLRKGTGAVVISSASGKEFAFESEQWQNGVFTYSLLEGLKSGSADSNKDNNISVSEIRDYVSKRVEELTNGKQHPTSRTENLENDYRIW